MRCFCYHQTFPPGWGKLANVLPPQLSGQHLKIWLVRVGLGLDLNNREGLLTPLSCLPPRRSACIGGCNIINIT